MLNPADSRLGNLLQELEVLAEEALSSGGDRKAKVLLQNVPMPRCQCTSMSC